MFSNFARSTVAALVLVSAILFAVAGCDSDRDTMPTRPAGVDLVGPAFDSYPLVADSILVAATPFADCDSVLVDVDVYLGYSALMVSAFYSLTATPGACGPYPNGAADWSPVSHGGGHWSLEFRMPASYFGGLEEPDDVQFAWCGQFSYSDDVGDFYYDMGVWVDEPFCTPAGGGGGGGGGGKVNPGQQ